MLAHRVAIVVLTVILFAASTARSQDCKPEIVNTFDTPGDPLLIAVAGDIAAIADGFDGVRFLDISDPTRPRSLSSVPATFAARDVAITGDVAAFIDTDALNATGFLKIVDIADPSNAEIVFSVSPGVMKPLAVAAWEDIVAFSMTDPSSGEGMMQLYDVSDPPNPELLSTIDTFAQNAEFHNGLLYTSGAEGFFIYDVSAPSMPSLVGSLEIPEQGRFLSISSDIAYVTTWKEGLFIIDISDPANPERLSSILSPESTITVVTKNAIAYVSFGPTPCGLDVVDATDPVNPVRIGSISVTGGAFGLAFVDDGYLLMANGSRGIHTIDISTCQPCPADLTGSSDPDDDTYGIPDGDADSDDFFFYLDAFVNGDMGVCDIDGDADCDADDFFGYLDLFAAGCE